MELGILRGHQSFVNSASFSPDGSRIVTASNDKTARIWNARNAREIAILRGHSAGVSSAAFSRRIARRHGIRGQDCPDWDAASAKEIAVLRGHNAGVRSAAFSPDGSRIVTASLDKTVRSGMPPSDNVGA